MIKITELCSIESTILSDGFAQRPFNGMKRTLHSIDLIGAIQRIPFKKIDANGEPMRMGILLGNGWNIG